MRKLKTYLFIVLCFFEAVVYCFPVDVFLGRDWGKSGRQALCKALTKGVGNARGRLDRIGNRVCTTQLLQDRRRLDLFD